MKRNLKLAVCFTLMSSTLAYGQSTIQGIQTSFGRAPLDQVFERGLKGIGVCKIVPAILSGISTWRVITSKSRPGVLGEGVFVIPVLGLNVAHGFVWDPAFSSALYRPNVLFPSAQYGIAKGANAEDNAAKMLKLAVASNLCDLSSSDFPQAESQSVTALSSDQIRSTTSFYVDASQNLKCSSNNYSVPVFNPMTCRWVRKVYPLSSSTCSRSFIKASVTNRAQVQSTGSTPATNDTHTINEPTMSAFTPEIDQNMIQASRSLDTKTQSLVQLGSSASNILEYVDLSMVPPNLGSPDHIESAARFKKQLDSIPAELNVDVPDFVNQLGGIISSHPQVLSYNQASIADVVPKSAADISIIKQGYLNSVADLYPNITLTPRCNPILNASIRFNDLAVE